CDRRHIGEREPRSDAARRGRLPLHRRSVGRALQDRCAFRQGRPDRVMDPGQEKVPLANRGAALWGNLVITVANYPPRMVATDKDTGKVAWEINLDDGQTDLQLTAAPLAVKDKIILGAAGGDRGVRDFIVALDAATGKLAWRKYVIPAPGEPGSETW